MKTLRKPNLQVIRTTRRALAMMLVLICLATATIATTAYLVSRDTSAAIGRNVAAAAAARWAASSGLDMAVAMLETAADWRSVQDGKIITSLQLADALIDVWITDAVTNGPPTASTGFVNVHVIATVGEVQQEAMGIVAVSLASKTASVDLSEFVVFARDRLELHEESIVTHWRSSPMSRLGRRIRLGTAAVDSGRFEIHSDAMALDAFAYYRADADPNLIRNQSPIALYRVPLPDPIVMPAPPLPGVDEPQSSLLGDLLGILSSAVTLVTDTVYKLLDLSGSSSIVTVKDSTLVIKEDLRLGSGAGIIVEGDVKIVVFGSAEITNDAYIELKPGSRLQLFVRGDIEMENGYIGDQRDVKIRDVSGNATWSPQTAVYIHPIVTASMPTWRFRGESVVKASLYGPGVRVRVYDTSAVYGRIASAELRVRHLASIFYDPSLDSGTGYDNTQSALYDNDGRIRSDVLSLASLEQSDLLALSTLLNVGVLARGQVIGSAPAADEAPPYLPTPRVIDVAFELVGFGTGVSKWEKAP